MGGSHAVFVEAATVFLPLAQEVAGGDGDLIGGGADHGVPGDPVGGGGEEVDARVERLAAGGHLIERSQLFFAAPARIVDFEVRIVTDLRKIAANRRRCRCGEFRGLVAVTEAARGVPHRELEGENLAGTERPIERVDGVKITGSPAHEVERPVELNVGNGLLLVGDVNLVDGSG